MNRTCHPNVPAICRYLLIVGLLQVTSAAAGEPIFVPDEYRVAAALDNFDDTWLVAGVYHLKAHKVLRASRVELTTGLKSSRSESRLFVSLGPIWRWRLQRSFYVEFGLSPTLLAGDTLDGRSLGGNLHFTSSAAVGRDIGNGRSISLRIQHTSNASIRQTNPGLNMVGLSITFGPSDQ